MTDRLFYTLLEELEGYIRWIGQSRVKQLLTLDPCSNSYYIYIYIHLLREALNWFSSGGYLRR